MRKPITLVFIVSLLCSPIEFVRATPNPDTGPGCGLGTKLWEDWKGQKQIAPQMLMATTNITGSYSFAISSGTSGCSHDGRIWDQGKASLFIGINYASLTEDIARGGGEYLASLAVLMQVPPTDQPAFFARVQAQYVPLVNLGDDNPIALQVALRAIFTAPSVLVPPPVRD